MGEATKQKQQKNYRVMGVKNDFFGHCAAIFVAGLAIFANTTAVSAATKVGSVSEVERQAYGTPPDGTRAAKHLTDGVVMNEALETVPQGSLTVDFIDDTNLLVGGNAKITVDDLVYDPSTRKGSALIRMAKGTFFWTSGKIVTKKDIRIETPVATIGIRGTEFSVTIGPDGQTNVSVISGLVDFVSKTTGQRVEIQPGFNANVGAAGNISKAVPGIFATGDKAVNGKIVSAAKQAAAAAKKAAAKANGNGNGNGSSNGKSAQAKLRQAERVLTQVASLEKSPNAKGLVGGSVGKPAKSLAKDAGVKQAAFTSRKSAAKLQTISFKPSQTVKSLAKHSAKTTAQTAARNAATDTAKSAAKVAAKDAAKDAAKGAAKDAAKDAAKSAAKDAAKAAAKDVVKQAAKDAAKGNGKGKGKS